MARSDLLLNLVKAGTSGDLALLHTTVEALIAEERSKQHHVLADRLQDNLHAVNRHLITKELDEAISDFVLQIKPQRRLEDLILSAQVTSDCAELIEEHSRRELLRSFNLEPRHKILLSGPPGNGKTSLAEALAEALFVPLVIVKYDAIIGSYLGETGQKLAKLFESIRSRDCVLFFDEFESISKERSDPHETGEIKRIVSSLLMQIDRLPSNVIVVAATNHPEMLDRAVWRRFQIQLSLPQPNLNQLEKWLEFFRQRTEIALCSDLRNELVGLSFAEVEQITTDIHRQFVLRQPKANLKNIVEERMNRLRENRKESD